MSISPIPLSEVYAYLDGAGIYGELDRQFSLEVVQALDEAFIEHYTKKEDTSGGSS